MTPRDLDDFLRDACLCYGPGDNPRNRERALTRLADTPSLASASTHAAAAVGDIAAVRNLLDTDPAAATDPGGPFGWPPLLYAAYSRLDSTVTGHSNAEAARLLLDNGADANSHYWWGGQYRFTALTGAFGEGEQGPVNQPRHRDCRELAELLLARGADPNDSQALYNTMFRRGSDCLAILLAHGLGTDAYNNWLVHDEDGKLAPHPEPTLRFQFRWACEHGHLDRVRLLIEHGVDVTTPFPSGKTPWEAATAAGYLAVAETLADHGAEKRPWTPVERLAGALTSADGTTARGLIAKHPGLVAEAARTYPGLLHEAARLGPAEAVALMLDVGLDVVVAGLADNTSTPLHEAAWHGQTDVVKLLLERGADSSVVEPVHDGTPLDWARHGGHAEIVELLESRG